MLFVVVLMFRPHWTASIFFYYIYQTAAEYISWGVGKGAEKAGELLKQGSTKLKMRLQQEDNPRPVDPRLQTGVSYVRKGSHTAVRVSGFLGKINYGLFLLLML